MKYKRKRIRYGYYQFVRNNLLSHIKRCAKNDDNKKALEYINQLKQVTLNFNYQ